VYIDRDIDSVMARTKKKRPIPLGQVSAPGALIFGALTGLIATALLWFYGSPLATFFGVGTIAFYVGVYTLYLKRRTPYNIVIGGAAGATAPLIGWAAGQNSLHHPLPWLLFALVFFWTPPHFWALSLVIKDDYKDAGVPMLPVVKGVPRTLNEIIIYTWLLGPIALAVGFLGAKPQWVYLSAALVLHGGFLYLVHQLKKSPTDRRAYGVFGYSILYLFFLFIFLVVDHWILQ
jgi:protoheme IX farnesyltransferase